MAFDIAVLKGRRAILFTVFYTLAIAQWFFTSSGFLTPSSYSLLMIPLGGTSLPWYSRAITALLDNQVSALLLPLISSGFYATLLAYAADVARDWFGFTLNKV